MFYAIVIAAFCLAALIGYCAMRKTAVEDNSEEVNPPLKKRFSPIMFVREDELGYESAGVVSQPYIEEVAFSEN